MGLADSFGIPVWKLQGFDFHNIKSTLHQENKSCFGIFYTLRKRESQVAIWCPCVGVGIELHIGILYIGEDNNDQWNEPILLREYSIV